MERRAFWMLLLMGIVLFGFMSTEVKAQQIVLRAVTAFPKPHLNNDPVPLFVDDVNKRAAGRLKIEWVEDLRYPPLLTRSMRSKPAQ